MLQENLEFPVGFNMSKGMTNSRTMSEIYSCIIYLLSGWLKWMISLATPFSGKNIPAIVSAPVIKSTFPTIKGDENSFLWKENKRLVVLTALRKFSIDFAYLFRSRLQQWRNKSNEDFSDLRLPTFDPL